MEQSARLPPQGAVTGWAALRLAGANFFDGLLPDGRTRIPVQLAVGAGANVRSDAEAVVSREPLTPDEIVVRYGVPCTRAARALFDEMRRGSDGRESVVAMDMVAAAELISIRQMRDYASTHGPWRRSRQAKRALDLASELSRSPNETRLRLIWVIDAGLPAPEVNCDVFDRTGRFVGTADLFDPVAGLVGEYDGADHRSARRHSRDAAREEDFRRLGLEYVKITGPDLRQPAVAVGRILSSHARARFLPAPDRAWTLEPPPDWPFSPALDEVLDQREWLASFHATG